MKELSLRGTSEEDREIIESFHGNNLQDLLGGGGSSVWSTGKNNSQKRYYTFEDSVKKRTHKLDISIILILYVLALLSVAGFTVFLQINHNTKRSEFKVRNSILVNFNEFSQLTHSFYGAVAKGMLYNKGVYKKDRYAGMNLTNISEGPPLMTDYSSLGYRLDDLPDFMSHRMRELNGSVFDILQLMYSSYGVLRENRKQLTSFNVVVRRTKPDKSIGTEKYSLHESYVLLQSWCVFEIANKKTEDLDPSKIDRPLNKFHMNIINELLIIPEIYKSTVFNDMRDNYQSVVSYMLFCLVFLSLMLIVFMVLSFIFIRRLHRSFKEIYISFLSLHEHEFQERLEQLTQLKEVLMMFKDSNYFDDMMGSRAMDNGGRIAKQSKKTTLAFSKGIFCFNLAPSIIFIGVYYIIQIAFCSVIILILQTSATKAITVSEKQQSLNQIIIRHSSYYDALMNYFEFGDDALYFNESMKVALPKILDEIGGEDSNINTITASNNILTGVSEIESYIKEISENSLCEYTASLKARNELCEVLDSRIPMKGIVQAYYRNQKFFLETFTKIIDSGYSTNIDSIITDRNFIEWEYAFDIIYIPAFIDIQRKVYTMLISFLDGMEQIDTRLNYALLVFCLSSIIMAYYSFKRLRSEAKKVSYSYQMLSINSVIENMAIKVIFLRVFKINVRQF